MKKTKTPKTKKKKPLIGFIGQGFIGKSYADDFENRGFTVVRYATKPPFSQNKEKIKECDIVFIAVPTPSTPTGFDDHVVREVVKLIGKGKIAVIKSTIVPGTARSIQKENPGIYVFHSPEFLTEATAAFDAANPNRNIVGIPVDTKENRGRAREVLKTLPKAPYELICLSDEAELVKYGGNCWFYFKVIFINMLYDVAKGKGIRYDVVKEAMAADPRIGRTHLDPIHKSGRGAGGHCFIKDFAAFSNFYRNTVGDDFGLKLLETLRDKNIDLLVQSGKDRDLLEGIYGSDFLKRYDKN